MLRCVCIILVLINALSVVTAATIQVGVNGCTLRDAIRSANADAPRGDCSAGSGNDTIIVPDNLSVVLTSTLPDIDTDMTITTQTDAGQLLISGDESHRIMRIRGTNTDVTLNRVKLINGQINSALSNGGAAIRITDASVIINDSEVSGHYAKDVRGAGIFIADGELQINGSVIKDNETDFSGVLTPISGGGIYADNAQVTITDSEFRDNHVPSQDNAGSSIFIEDGDLTVRGSLINETFDGILGKRSTVDIENSTFDRTPGSISAFNQPMLEILENSVLRMNHVTIGSDGYIAYDSQIEISNTIVVGRCFTSGSTFSVETQNLYRSTFCTENPDSFFLNPPQDNGGPTLTSEIEYNSVAVNNGDPVYCAAEDQRGEMRGVLCDIGAYEVNDVADISVQLVAAENPPYATGQNMLVSLVLTNNGPATASLIRLVESSVNVTITDVDSFFCSSFPCTWPFLSPGSQINIPITVQFTSIADRNFTLEVEASTTLDSLHTDFIPGNNSDTFSGTTVAGADVEITKTLQTPPPYFVGQNIEYLLEVRNLGVQSAANVVVTEQPDNLNIQSFSGCDSVNGNDCLLGSVGTIGQRNITVNATITDDFFDNIASVSSDTFDPDMSNNVDDQFNGGAVTTADLKLSMELLTDPPYYSDQFLNYQITITSTNNAATDVTLYSELPGAIYLGIDTCITIPCVIPSLGAGNEIQLQFQMFAPLYIPGIQETFTHTAELSAGQTDPDPDNNVVMLTDSLNPAANVSAQLSLQSSGPYYVGQDVQYLLRITNGGLNLATQIAVDMMPDNLQIISVNGNSCQQEDCLIPAIDVFQTEEIFIVARPLQVGSFDMGVTAFSPVIDPDERDNEDVTGNSGMAELIPDDVIFENGFDL